MEIPELAEKLKGMYKGDRAAFEKDMKYYTSDDIDTGPAEICKINGIPHCHECPARSDKNKVCPFDLFDGMDGHTYRDVLEMLEKLWDNTSFEF